MGKCSFCGKDIESGTGTIFVKKDGTIFTFCSGKCSKNMLKLGRVAQKVKWTQTYHKIKQIMKEGK